MSLDWPDTEGIEIPFPIRTVYMRERSSGTQLLAAHRDILISTDIITDNY